MKKKCTWDGNKLNLCNNLDSVIRGHNGEVIGLTCLYVARLADGEGFNNGVIYKYGNSKKAMVVISYCPACGENIEPKYIKLDKNKVATAKAMKIIK